MVLYSVEKIVSGHFLMKAVKVTDSKK